MVRFARIHYRRLPSAFESKAMKPSLFILGFVLMFNLRSLGDGVEGRVTLRGIPPPEIPIQMSADCAQGQIQPTTTRHFVTNRDGGLANVLVVIRGGLWKEDQLAAPQNAVAMNCVACQLEPYVVAVRTGQPVLFRNDSRFQENLHFDARANRARNIGFPSGATYTATFDQAEDFIRIKGDMHPWFFGYVCVVDHPFFAVTGLDGKFQLPDGLYDGQYVLEAKHLKAGAAKMEITVRNGRTDPVEFRLEVPARK